MLKTSLCLTLGLGGSASLAAAEHLLSVSDFTPAEQCAICHVEIYSQWQTSMHSKAATDQLFHQLLPQAARDLGDRGVGFCLTCHTPVATVAKEVAIHSPVTLPLKLSSMAMEGVTCDFCHTISGNEHFGSDISTGIYRYPRKGETSIKSGVHTDAATTDHMSRPSKFLQSSEFCAICHKFNHPFSGERLQDTYEEWKSGPYAKNAKKGGKQCQDCHMPLFTGSSATNAPVRTNLHMHVFPGGHSDMVKKVATVTAWVQMEKKAGKRQAKLKAQVANVGSGHFMPTGLPGLRQMWLEVVVRDDKGAEVFANKNPIGIEGLGADGKPTMPWNAVRFGKDTRIGPQEYRQWDFPLPEAKSGPLELRVSVYYRLISELAAQAAGINSSPALEIASDRLRLLQDGRVEKRAPD